MTLLRYSAALVLLAAPLANAQDEPFAATDAPTIVTLLDEAYVTGPQVRLGDVADIEGPEAEVFSRVELGPAAVPGSSKRLTPSLLLSRLRLAGYQDASVDFRGAAAVEATTLAVDITPEVVAEDLRNFILDEMPWDAASSTIDVRLPRQAVTVPEGDLDIEWMANPQYDYLGTGLFRGKVVVDGDIKRNVICQATVETYVDVVVADREIPRGTLISTRHLRLEKQALSPLQAGVYTDMAEVAGMKARSTVFPGTVIRSRHAAQPRIFRRNQEVTVEARAGSLLVRSRAVAMTDGYAGEVATCRNPDSKEEFTGVVRDDGVVVVN
jgi:flagella basal body P-ring formation protein FlgA